MSEHVFEVTVKTRAKQKRIERTGDLNLKIWVTAAPEKGKANAQIVDIIADYFHIPKSAVEILRGTTSTKKKVRILR